MKLDYRRDIDGLRAVAILLVLGFHAFPEWLPGGFIGVDVFFVISGFLISGILIDNLESGRFLFADFYARRIRRIFPALIVVLASCLAFGWFTLFPDEYAQLGKHAAAGAGFVSNLVLWGESGYFDTAADRKPLLHLWSLGIEEQFYIVWPVLLFLAWKSRIRPVFACLGLLILSFGFNVSLAQTDRVADFYAPTARFWELLAGAALASGLLRSQQQQPGYRELGSFLGIALIALTAGAVNSQTTFPGWWAIAPTLGACFLVSAGPGAWVNRTILGSRPMVWIGLISYPLYLWHWPLLSFARILDGQRPSVAMRGAAVAASAALAGLTYVGIERPVRFGRFRGRTVLAATLLMAVVGGFGFVTHIRDGFESRVSSRAAADLKQDGAKESQGECDAFLGPEYDADFCRRSADRPPTLAMIGDSHAASLYRGVDRRDKGGSWLLLGSSSCPPVSGILVSGDVRACDHRSQRVLDYVSEMNSIETVVLVFFGGYFLDTDVAADHKENGIGPSTIKITSSEVATRDKRSLFAYGLEKTVKQLQRHNKKVILFVDVPELPFSPRDCLDRPLGGGTSSQRCRLSRREVLDRQRELRAMLASLVEARPEVRLFDPLDLVCDDQWCRYEAEGRLLYADSHHLSEFGSEGIAVKFLQWLAQETGTVPLLSEE